MLALGQMQYNCEKARVGHMDNTWIKIAIFFVPKPFSINRSCRRAHSGSSLRCRLVGRIAEHACNGALLIYSGGFNPYGQKGANQQESLL